MTKQEIASFVWFKKAVIGSFPFDLKKKSTSNVIFATWPFCNASQSVAYPTFNASSFSVPAQWRCWQPVQRRRVPLRRRKGKTTHGMDGESSFPFLSYWPPECSLLHPKHRVPDARHTAGGKSAYAAESAESWLNKNGPTCTCFTVKGQNCAMSSDGRISSVDLNLLAAQM